MEGLTVRVRPLQAKKLLKPDCTVLNVLGRFVIWKLWRDVKLFLIGTPL